MRARFVLISLFLFGVFMDTYTLPVEIQNHSNHISNNLNKRTKQFEEDGDEDGFTLSPNVASFIGNNVGKLVASSLTGNVGGIFSGGLNLLNTNNRVNGLLGGLVGGNIAAAPNGTVTAAPVATTSAPTAASTDDEDSDNEDEDEDARSKKFAWQWSKASSPGK